MSETRLLRVMTGQAVFVALCLGCIFIRLLPVNMMPVGVPGPDVMLCFALAYAIRRPDLVPPWLIVPLFLLADMLLMRPPGLWTLLVLGAVQFLRARNRRTRSWSASLELLAVAILVTALALAQWFTLTLLLVRQPGLFAQLAQVPSTMIAYPLVVLICQFGLHIRKRPVPEGFGRGARA